MTGIIMKQLQNNFTTPEQSRRLLELGLPADSADCYSTRFGIDEEWETKVLHNIRYSELAIENQNYCLPCWSVGRLIEIIMLCGVSAKHKLRPVLDSDLYETHDTLIEYLIQELEESSEEWYDFSKLEE